MISIVQRALNLATKLGADEADVFASDNVVITIRIASNHVVETKLVQDRGIGVCAAIKNKVGFSSGNKFNQELVKRALAIARARPPNPKFNGFPTPKRASKPSAIYDRDLAVICRSKIVELAEEMLQAALDFDKKLLKFQEPSI